MPFWSTQRVREEQARHGIISDFRADRLKQGAYELSLSNEALSSTDPTSCKCPETITTWTITIPPGQFALLYTKESVKIPIGCIAFLSIKAGIKLQGLVNISGFHVDPGFEGHLKFSVYNAGNQTIILDFGQPCFLLWLAEFDEPVEDPYDGMHKGQQGITTSDRKALRDGIYSPAALHGRLAHLERSFSIWRAAGFAILVPLLIGLFVGWVFDSQKNSNPQMIYFVTNPASTNLQAIPEPASR